MGVIEIGNLQLILAAGFMVIAGVVSWREGMGLERDIAISTLRAFLQLIALGLVLKWVFDNQTWWMVLLILLVMVANATQIGRGRVKNRPDGITPQIFITLLVTSLTMLLVVVELIVRPELWYDARVVVGIMGMILGNAMSSSAVALDRTFASLDDRADEMLAMVAMGATPREAARPSIVASVRSGMIPTLATLSAAGLVNIPGMMTGQILAGTPPVMAIRYQIMVTFMLLSTTSIASFLACYLSYRSFFNDYKQLR